jgi:sugar phosphate isomerase/epimerase
MIPAIGITTQVIRQAKWYKHVSELGFNTVEINRQNSKLHFNLFFLEKVKRYMRGFDLSVHSGTSGIFQPRESFTKANLAILTAEVDVCSFLGARQFVFHLSDGFMTSANKRRLQEVLSYAADSEVEMLYESNSALVADYAYDVLGTFPDLGYVLDLGHLNNGYGSGKLGCAIDDFVRQAKNRVVYVHASNNSGGRDDHSGLETGTLDWRHVLDLLDFSIIKKVIIEVRKINMVHDSALELMRYFGGDFLSQKYRLNQTSSDAALFPLRDERFSDVHHSA